MAVNFHNCAKRGQKLQVIGDPLDLERQLQVGLVRLGVEHLAFDAVVGRVAVGHVLVGRAEERFFFVLLRRRPASSSSAELALRRRSISHFGTCQYWSALASR